MNVPDGISIFVDRAPEGSSSPLIRLVPKKVVVAFWEAVIQRSFPCLLVRASVVQPQLPVSTIIHVSSIVPFVPASVDVSILSTCSITFG